MDLQTIWFILITILFTGFFILEGFDFGVGILHPFMSNEDRERRTVINTIGPFWDGNEVWLITAGGAMFAAFPEWYATLFSGFYLALLLMLVALIFRGVAFEFRSKHDNPAWRNFWDWSIFAGSAIPALLWGVALANFIRGVPIDQSMNYAGGFFNLLNPYALVCGLASLSIFTLHGAVFLTLKTTGSLQERAMNLARKVWASATFLSATFTIYTFFETDLFQRLGVNPGIIPVFSVFALLSVIVLLKKNACGWAFAMTSIAIGFSSVTIFMGLFPRVLVSSLNPDWSLTIYNSSSSDYTLGIMTIVAAIFVPIVLLYQGWSYWIFRQRISPDSDLEY
ncbi:MAG: cytochrome d ubiquinol oxidase subunit II [Chlorobium sp.]|jgi:cytochrome d ubiquinol oxidase subunit II|uniref:cytochrome d ubiquinol oxidase subunit II n=1 Tax=Chlorobium sp. TaxID=1095 RepID=UPI0025BBB109|nr:cytochrome d ubiquinol oxidase subunit II [Chlorobium sp.]MCF8215939.1 cytochrome d ubiquinol oxidase subunit II [Chlorobium sp.]MCF8270837.1 cytochrome d ubiquinol oxidase subunit II [Chlorobium sp.]MCF8287149.1 cytochrome d ubiquinol oxidase subunit II [Chlorobium sp.]MCF8290806.1 cytochrome d ubiquinol oxidase subunit II [Chlorobium sp.]MCF8384910.1 cytochrome d ubiquinol oxidase subunit II [Chlorobium sp.]